MVRGYRDFRADVGIKDGRVKKNRAVSARLALARELDAKGCIVAPGFRRSTHAL